MPKTQTHSDKIITTISYNDLVSYNENPKIANELMIEIGNAFGNSDTSLGIIAVSDVPNFGPLRSALLPLAHQIASWGQHDLDALTDESSGYTVGWSHGKERVEDDFDTSKGSFYANPLTDEPLQEILERDYNNEENSCREEKTKISREEFENIAKDNPAFFAPNIWPATKLPRLKCAFMEMGKLIHDIGKIVAKLCDDYVLEKCPGFSPGKLGKIIADSRCCKARLLHYFALDAIEAEPLQSEDDGGHMEEDSNFSSWCGWHNDHGSLTGLVPAMYLDVNGTEVECTDPFAGLYIKSRRGDIVHAKLSPNSIAFQIGETAQIHTGGILQATPHAVRGCDGKSGESKGVSRESFAVFMEPEYHGDMNIPQGTTIEDAQKKEAQSLFPKTVRTLQSRWQPGMNFGEFSTATFAAFQ